MFKRLILLFLLLSSSVLAKDILISFDGSARLHMWQDSLNFAKEHNVKFTYFISAPYFLTKEEVIENTYWAPKEKGIAPLQFRETKTKYGITERFKYLGKALDEGHEIGSHLVGHYNGVNWTAEEWDKEFKFFKWTFSRNNYKEKPLMDQITGIRAPCLGVNKAYYETIKKYNYEYDSSTVYKRGSPAVCGSGKVPMWKIELVGLSRTALPFDYEFSIIKDISQEPSYQENLFFESLCNDYLTNHLPTTICLHFEKYEGDPYYNATKRFILWVKDKNPNFLTYKEYYRSL